MVREACHTARIHNDIDDSWREVVTVIDVYAANEDNFAQAAGPGYFNDPDMVIIAQIYTHRMTQIW